MDRTRRCAAIALHVIAASALVVGACSPTPSPTIVVDPTAPPIEATPIAGEPGVMQSPWGPIWDAVPPEFLLFAGARPVEVAEAVSAALDHPAEAASPADIANGYVSDLAISGWQAIVDGPTEDGSMVVEAVRGDEGCRAQVRATPLGGFVRISILYGASCPSP